MSSNNYGMIKRHFKVLVRSTKFKRKILDIIFHKLLAIANLRYGDVWLQEIKKHWDTIDMPQMLLEKLHKLVLV
jgi:hypothetical protein